MVIIFSRWKAGLLIISNSFTDFLYSILNIFIYLGLKIATVYSVSLGSLLKVTKIQNIFSISSYRQFKEPKLNIWYIVRQFMFPFSDLKMKICFWNLVTCNHPYTQYHWLCDNHCNGLLDMVFFQRKKVVYIVKRKKKSGHLYTLMVNTK